MVLISSSLALFPAVSNISVKSPCVLRSPSGHRHIKLSSYCRSHAEFIQVPTKIHLAHVECFKGTSNWFSCWNYMRLSGAILGYIDSTGFISGRLYNLIRYQDINETRRKLSERYIMGTSHRFAVHLSAQRSEWLPSKWKWMKHWTIDQGTLFELVLIWQADSLKLF